MNWQGSFSAFSPRVSSTTLESLPSSSDSSPEQKPGAVLSPSSDSDVPLSRTHQYKKITKPLLERKRRARINKCLDELKDIMTVALQAEGENVSKLEKADILELTVRHLHKLNQSQGLVPKNPIEELQRFQAGYTSCAQEAATFLLSTPGVDVRLGQRLFGQLFQPSSPAGPGYPSFPPPQSAAPPSLDPLQPSSILSLPSPSRPPPSSSHPSSAQTGAAASLHPSGSLPPSSVVVKQEEKTVPVKPEALRLMTATGLADLVWKPYS